MKLLPALIPILFVGALLAILITSSDLGRDFHPKGSPTPPNGFTQPPASPQSQQNPRPTPDESSSGAYSVSQYPFVNRPYSWKLHKGRGQKYTFRFNTDGSVTQNFQSSPMRWRPNHTYSVIMSSKTGWFVDVVFDSEFNRITGRPQGEQAVYVGVALR